MSGNKRVSDSRVKYYIILDDDSGELYKIGSIMIKRGTGDIHFFPGFEFYFPVNEGDVSELRKLDHLSYHASGEWHLIVSEGTINHRVSQITTCILELGENWKYENINDITMRRVPIKDIMFQEMFGIVIKDYKKLEKFEKKIDEIDQIFRIGNLKSKHIGFQFNIISGKFIIKNLSSENKNSENNSVLQSAPCHQVERMCLGDESGNADKLLEYSIHGLDTYNYTGAFTFNFYYDNPLNREVH